MGAKENLEQEIYCQYRENMSQVIAYIEVYKHDITEKMFSRLREVFARIANYALETEEREALANQLKDAYNVAEQDLYFQAIGFFLVKIKEFKKTFRKYNYKGIRDKKRGRFFYEIAEEQERQIQERFRKTMDSYYQEFFRSQEELLVWDMPSLFGSWIRVKTGRDLYSIQSMFWPIETFGSIDGMKKIELKELYEDLKGLVEYYESFASEVWGSGSTVSRSQIWWNIFFSYILPAVLLIPVFWKMYQLFIL